MNTLKRLLAEVLQVQEAVKQLIELRKKDNAEVNKNTDTAKEIFELIVNKMGYKISSEDYITEEKPKYPFMQPTKVVKQRLILVPLVTEKQIKKAVKKLKKVAIKK